MVRYPSKNMVGRIASACVVALLLGCSSTQGAPSTDAGTFDASAAAKVCADGCKTQGTCFASSTGGQTPRQIDQPACEKQCALEVAGQGYLRAEVASKAFGLLASRVSTGDPECKLGGGLFQFVDADYTGLEDQGSQDKCVAQYRTVCSDLAETVAKSECFDKVYQFNAQLGARMSECLGSADCTTATQCLGERTLSVLPRCQPWFGPTGRCP